MIPASLTPPLSADGSSAQPPAITRTGLQQDALRRHLAERHPDMPLWGDADHRRSIEDMLARRSAASRAFDGVFVFAYGSLIWNPCVDVAERRTARLHGYHRDFRLRIEMGRGTPETPGLMLALVGGGSCRGMALRIPSANLYDELLLIWRREMLTGAYRPRGVDLATPDNPVPAIAFVANQGDARYVPRLDEATTAEYLRTGRGDLGTCAEYLDKTVTDLRARGLRDRRLERLWRMVGEAGSD